MKTRNAKAFRSCALAISLFLAAIVSATGREGATGQGNSAAENPPARVARLSFIKGSVSFLRASVQQWSDAALNYPVTTGDRIYTDKGARTELQVGNFTVRLSEHTDLTVTNLNDQILQLGLQEGTLDRKSTRLNSSHQIISYAVFCLKKKKKSKKMKDNRHH